MRSRAGSWHRKEGSHLQSLDPSRVALLESRSSTTITSAIVVRRLVPLELSVLPVPAGECFVEAPNQVAGTKSPDPARAPQRTGSIGLPFSAGSEMQRGTDQRRPSQQVGKFTL